MKNDNDDLGSKSIGEPKWRFKSFFNDISDDFEKKLKILHTELLKANSSVNIIPGKHETDADYMHFADCYMACKSILAKDPAKTIYDIAPASVLSGVIIALLAPDRTAVIFDNDGKKMEFAKHLGAVLGLSNLKVNIGRVEDLPEASISSAIVRGTIPITKYLLLMRKPIAANGMLHHMKGNTWAREVGDIPSQICAFWKPELCAEYQLPISGARMAVVTTIKR